jgi:hypothetical protein
MATSMKFDEKFQKVSEKSQKRMERAAIILGVLLLVVSSISYFAIEAFAQQDFVKLDCPKDAYYGFDNQGNTVCRDIETNQILEPESAIIIDSDSKKISESEPWIITNPETGEIILNDNQTSIVQIIIFGLIGIGAFIGISAKNKNFNIFQRHGWSGFEKEQVRERQYGKCNMCYTITSKWKYDYIDGNKNNNDLINCQALCPDCYSVKTERDNRVIYQNSN